MVVVEGALHAELAPDASPPSPSTRLRQLVDLHFEFVARSLRRLGVPEVDVDDAAQQVFLVAGRKLDGIVNGHEKSFLFGIAVRTASDHRRAMRRRTAGETAAADFAEIHPETPEDLATTRQARALLDVILDAMPMDVRSVFTLFELEGMTMAQIAQMLRIPAGTVASRLRRGREMFHAEAKKLRESGKRRQTMGKP
jgi:RNA polymerase sigma-70 factor (ECF subfamily)